MEMFYIILLVLFGMLFLVAEIVLLPGISIGGLLALACDGTAIYLAFTDYDPVVGIVVILVILALAVAATVFSLRAKTWQRFSLKQEIRSSSMPTPSEELRVGDRGTTVSRLSPMGKVEIEGRIYEAKSNGAYVDQKSEVEVVGFENFNVIVKLIK